MAWCGNVSKTETVHKNLNWSFFLDLIKSVFFDPGWGLVCCWCFHFHQIGGEPQINSEWLLRCNQEQKLSGASLGLASPVISLSHIISSNWDHQDPDAGITQHSCFSSSTLRDPHCLICLMQYQHYSWSKCTANLYNWFFKPFILKHQLPPCLFVDLRPH